MNVCTFFLSFCPSLRQNKFSNTAIYDGACLFSYLTRQDFPRYQNGMYHHFFMISLFYLFAMAMVYFKRGIL